MDNNLNLLLSFGIFHEMDYRYRKMQWMWSM